VVSPEARPIEVLKPERFTPSVCRQALSLNLHPAILGLLDIILSFIIFPVLKKSIGYVNFLSIFFFVKIETDLRNL